LKELSPVSINTWIDLCHPDDLEKSKKLLNDLFLGKTDYYLNEVRMKHKNGHWVWVQIQGKVFEWGKDRKPLRVTGIHIDINERKRTDAELRESEEKYRSMMEAMTDPVYICSQDYRVEYANPAMIKRTGRDIVGEYCFKAIHDLEKKCPWCVHDMIQQGKSLEQDIISPRDNRSFQVSHFPIVHDDESISKMTVYRDTTDLKKMETQLLQAQKIEAIGALAGGIAHDFNNILFPIVGFAEMLEEDLPENSDLHKNVGEILTGAKRAKDLVKQILTFSRQSEQEIKPLKPHLIIKEVAKLIRSTIPTSIEIKKFIDAATLPILADPTQIHQVAMNLITNAYQAMQESGGVLTIRLQNIEGADIPKNDVTLDHGPHVLLSIGDTGPGIDKITLEKIFDPYFTTKSKGNGTGLGLSVVLGIVKNYGGEISVKSSQDQGTIFDVYFPAIEHDTKPEEDGAVMQMPMGNERILLVDDEKQVLTIEQMILTRLGYKVVCKDSSIDALEAIKADPHGFDLVISDMTMPNMTGDQLALKIMGIKPTLPIIICTGFSETITWKKVESMGVKALLMKPIIKSKIAITVRKVLDEAKTKDTR
jgi:signal transduction histidine kinase/CheY-like chemotaxis protein